MDTPTNQDLRFLVVDDQFNVRRMVLNFLRTFGYSKFLDAADGARAFEILRINDVDFIVCDWNMPNMNGLEFLKKVRTQTKTKNLPFLMVTAEVAEDWVAEAAEYGVDDYIVKPFQADTLKAKIDAILKRRDNPSPVDMALQAGDENLHRGQIDQALEDYRNALNLSPKSPRVHLSMGQALEAGGDTDSAIDHYKQSLEVSDRFLRGHLKLAEVYQQRGDAQAASRHLSRAAQISPRNPQRHFSLGKLLLEQGENDKAVQAFNRARDASGKDASLATEIGEVLLEAGLNQEAAQSFEYAVEINPQVIFVYNRLGIALRRQKLFSEAVKQYEKALDIAPQDENLFYNLAVVHIEDSQLGPARHCLSQALKINPKFQEARNLLERLPK